MSIVFDSTSLSESSAALSVGNVVRISLPISFAVGEVESLESAVVCKASSAR